MPATSPRLLASVCVWCVLWSGAVADDTETTATLDGDDWSTSTVTRIEYGPFGFMKIKIPRRQPSEVESNLVRPLKKILPKKKSKEPEKKKPTQKDEVRFVNLWLFCLFQHDNHGPDGYYQEWIDLPLVTGVARGKTRDGGSLRVLNAPFFEFIDHYSKGDTTKTRFIDVPLAKVFNRSKSGDSDHWTFAQAPLACLVKREKTSARSQWTLLKLPFFYLYGQEVRQDGRNSYRFLRLPLLGPLWSYRASGDGNGRHRVLDGSK